MSMSNSPWVRLAPCCVISAFWMCSSAQSAPTDLQASPPEGMERHAVERQPKRIPQGITWGLPAASASSPLTPLMEAAKPSPAHGNGSAPDSDPAANSMPVSKLNDPCLRIQRTIMTSLIIKFLDCTTVRSIRSLHCNL